MPKVQFCDSKKCVDKFGVSGKPLNRIYLRQKSDEMLYNSEDRRQHKQLFEPLGWFCKYCEKVYLESSNPPISLGRKKPLTKVKVKVSKPTRVKVKDKYTKKQKQKPVIVQKITISRKELSVYGDVTNCIICGNLCIYDFHGIADGQPKGVFDGNHIPKQYFGLGMACFYPDGKQINDDKRIQGKRIPVCCMVCNEKHFERTHKDGISRKPITDIGKRVVAEHCTFPYPDKYT